MDEEEDLTDLSALPVTNQKNTSSDLYFLSFEDPTQFIDEVLNNPSIDALNALAFDLQNAQNVVPFCDERLVNFLLDVIHSPLDEIGYSIPMSILTRLADVPDVLQFLLQSQVLLLEEEPPEEDDPFYFHYLEFVMKIAICSENFRFFDESVLQRILHYLNNPNELIAGKAFESMKALSKSPVFSSFFLGNGVIEMCWEDCRKHTTPHPKALECVLTLLACADFSVLNLPQDFLSIISKALKSTETSVLGIRIITALSHSVGMVKKLAQMNVYSAIFIFMEGLHTGGKKEAMLLLLDLMEFYPEVSEDIVFNFDSFGFITDFLTSEDHCLIEQITNSCASFLMRFENDPVKEELLLEIMGSDEEFPLIVSELAETGEFPQAEYLTRRFLAALDKI